MQKIEKEMKSAQHLLYVSLKYTKTCDVILNLIHRWQQMIEISIDTMLEKAKKKKLIKEIPAAPIPKIGLALQLFKKEELVVKTINLYSFFRRINNFQQFREHEFRKNVALRVVTEEKEIVIDMDKMKEWQALLENFIKFTRTYIA
jgi:hypothetical protein